MDYVVIEGIHPYEGRYEFDLEERELTTREWGWIKRLAGYLPLDLDEEQFGDPEVLIVFAAIALRRAGKIEAKDVPQVFERLSDAPFGAAVTLESDVADEQEADAGPPPASSNSNDGASGPSSSPSSETSAPTPKASGTRGSVSSVSAPVRSASTPRRS